jgi:nucleotide-binding universal stress UspA family protein
MTDPIYARILVPIDGSPCSDEAAVQAAEIARAMGSVVVFLYVMDTIGGRSEGVVNMGEALEALTVAGRAIVERAERTGIAAGVRTSGELEEGSPVQVIARRAPEFDLVVMGSHGKGILKRITVGSVTRAVLRRIEQPLLVVRARQKEPPTG